jgi:hypothetical protein
MDIDISAIDRNLSDISGKIDFYSFLTPINQEEERKRFFSSLEENKPYNPVFCYKSERDFSAEREWLEDTRKLLDPEDPLHQIFVKNADFISAHLDMLESDDKGFSELAIKSFGSPDKDSVDLARKILDEGRASGYIFPRRSGNARRDGLYPREKIGVRRHRMGRRYKRKNNSQNNGFGQK